MKVFKVDDRVMTVGIVMAVGPTAFLIRLTAYLINIRFRTSKLCQMPIWNIKTVHRRNLLGTVITIPTVITLLPTLGLQAEL